MFRFSKSLCFCSATIRFWSFSNFQSVCSGYSRKFILKIFLVRIFRASEFCNFQWCTMLHQGHRWRFLTLPSFYSDTYLIQKFWNSEITKSLVQLILWVSDTSQGSSQSSHFGQSQTGQSRHFWWWQLERDLKNFTTTSQNFIRPKFKWNFSHLTEDPWKPTVYPTLLLQSFE